MLSICQEKNDDIAVQYEDVRGLYYLGDITLVQSRSRTDGLQNLQLVSKLG